MAEALDPSAWGAVPVGGPAEWGAVPVQEPGVFERMATDLHNQRAAASQGTTPIMSAQMHHLLSDDVQVGDDDNLYFRNPKSGEVEPTDSNKHVVLRDPADQKLKVFARSEDTNEGKAASLGRLLSPGMGAGNIGISKAAPAIVGAAERIGVDVPRAVAAESPLIRQAGQIAAKAPGGGPMHKAVERGLEQLGGATERAAEIAGGEADVAGAGASVRAGFSDYFKPQAQQAVTDLYNRVDSLVSPTGKAPLTKTTEIVSDILARRTASGESSLGKAVDTVSEAIKRPGGLTYQGIKDLRTRVGEMVDTGFLPADMSGGELKRIYGALSEDLGGAVQALGGDKASRAFEVANSAARVKANWLEQLDKVVGPKSRSDEGVLKTLHNMAQKGASADARTLQLAQGALPPEAWQNVASTVINRLGRNKAGEFSPALFVRDYGNLSDAGRKILFGPVGAGKLIPFLNDIAEVSDKFVKAGRLGNPSGTAGHGAGIGLVAAAGTGLAHGSWVEPVAAVSTALGVNMIARALAVPATAASMARWARAYDKVLYSPGPQSLASFNVASRALGHTMAAASGDAALAPQLTQRIQNAPRQAGEGQNLQNQ